MTRKLGHKSVDKFIYTDLLPVVVLSRTTDGLLIQLDLFFAFYNHGSNRYHLYDTTQQNAFTTYSTVIRHRLNLKWNL